MSEEKNAKMDRGLLSGSTTLLVLRLLEHKDMYGYEMIETLDRQSDHVFALKTGTLYPLLHTLEVKGCVTSYENSENAKPRRYYRLTPRGRKLLEERKAEWARYSRAMRGVLEAGR